MKQHLASVTLAAIVLLTAGCASFDKKVADLNKSLNEFETLGIVEVRIPGRATNTTYIREDKDGIRRSTLTHTNPGLSGPAVIVREVPVPVSQ